MKSPKPAPKGQPQLNAGHLTTRGTPRKRAAGAGRPALTDPRCKTLPRITVAAHQHLHGNATRQRIRLADALEIAIMTLHKRSKPSTQDNALAACRSIIFAGKQAAPQAMASISTAAPERSTAPAAPSPNPSTKQTTCIALKLCND